MVTATVWSGRHWRVIVPRTPLTPGHLAIIATSPDVDDGVAAAYDWLDCYRRVRAALWHGQGYRGFMVSFGVGWTPAMGRVGEPDPIPGVGQVVHVFGRGSSSDPTSPIRAMAAPVGDRVPAELPDGHVEVLGRRLADTVPIVVGGPSRDACDGCRPTVLRDQERWRADDVRVIRPMSPVIDPHVLVMPLRHVVSLGDLTPREIISTWRRLEEARAQFALSSGSTGLSCFVNDGAAARQETPHVHVHVFGRSAAEAVNPFAALAHSTGSVPSPTRDSPPRPRHASSIS